MQRIVRPMSVVRIIAMMSAIHGIIAILIVAIAMSVDLGIITIRIQQKKILLG